MNWCWICQRVIDAAPAGVRVRCRQCLGSGLDEWITIERTGHVSRPARPPVRPAPRSSDSSASHQPQPCLMGGSPCASALDSPPVCGPGGHFPAK